jgi:hypothetical protein
VLKLKLKIKSCMILSLTTAFAFQVVAVNAETYRNSSGVDVVEKEAIALAEEASMNQGLLIGREHNDISHTDSGNDLPSNEIREAFESIMENDSGESFEGDGNE